MEMIDIWVAAIVGFIFGNFSGLFIISAVVVNKMKKQEKLKDDKK